MILLISYDLNDHERPSAYATVRKAIEEAAISFRRPLYSQWLVETRSTAAEWQRYLLGAIDTNDRLFICQVTRENGGYLDREIWEWLKARVPG